ncbi:hypothetical protein Clacol_003736 [Clathrus columnatus]|uniref:Uncharacterized protein n=1 Tax=Clathrus columnatus TaxID=1419009 RepID=A0AAV5A7R9_9AGAM|nr:hypothetical protein Clacol_003736 [Clathrus columnatus]
MTSKTAWARERIDEALREEVEAGTVSYNDLERTKEFASNAVRYQYYTTFSGAGAVAGTVFYRHWYRRQPFNLRSLVFLPLVYTLGSAPGWFAQAHAFKQYQRDLDDPKNTIRLLMKGRGVVVLTGNDDPKHGKSLQMDAESFDESNQKGSRWEELRKEANIARPSTWDRIRQKNHETPGHVAAPPSSSTQMTQDLHSSPEKEIEQAKFDALLEAERKMSES